ncbi:nucleoside-triphosphatase THEP1 [Rhodoblastus acidophilus]|nr:nucleoside-triphosphatase THEP1 [Rhodoblastus acidophilus]
MITGGPGVGKTTLLDAILRILAAKKVELLLAAPTCRLSSKGVGAALERTAS